MLPSFWMRSRRMTSIFYPLLSPILEDGLEADRVSASTVMISGLLEHVGQKTQKARALDRLREFALLLGRYRGDARWHDLAALGDEALQELHVLVVDCRRVIARERAAFATTEEGAPCRPALTLSHQLDSLSKEKSISSKPRPPRPPKPRPPRSSRLLPAFIMAEGPSSCFSTRTVMKRMTSSLIDIWRSISAIAAGGASISR